MNHYYILLGISFSLLTMLLVWLWLIKTPGVFGKITFTLLLPLLYILHWFALKETSGWPSEQTLPRQFELITADVVEPNPLNGVTGNIHLWIRHKENTAPRSYRLPYTRDLHARLFEAKKRMERGRTQIGLLFDQGSRETGGDIGGGMKLKFKNAPRKRLPPKPRLSQ